MPLIQLVISLIVVGVILWFISYILMQDTPKPKRLYDQRGLPVMMTQISGSQKQGKMEFVIAVLFVVILVIAIIRIA